MASSVTYRRAQEADLPRVLELLAAGNLDPRDVMIDSVLVAEVDGVIVGVNRLKRYPDGAQEIASAYVIPEYRKHGINRRLTEILRDEISGTVFVITNPINEDYVARMGFRRLFSTDGLPDSIREKVDWCRARYTTHEPGIFILER